MLQKQNKRTTCSLCGSNRRRIEVTVLARYSGGTHRTIYRYCSACGGVLLQQLRLVTRA